MDQFLSPNYLQAPLRHEMFFSWDYTLCLQGCVPLFPCGSKLQGEPFGNRVCQNVKNSAWTCWTHGSSSLYVVFYKVILCNIVLTDFLMLVLGNALWGNLRKTKLSMQLKSSHSLNRLKNPVTAESTLYEFMYYFASSRIQVLGFFGHEQK